MASARRTGIAFLAIAAMYACVCVVLAHGVIAGAVNTYERGAPVTSTYGSPSLAVYWRNATLARATFFAEHKSMLASVDPIDLAIHIESPLGVPVATDSARFRISREGSLVVTFTPPLETGDTLGITLVGADSIQWKYQTSAGNSRLVRTHGDDSLAALLLPARTGGLLLALAILGVLLAGRVLWLGPRQRFFVTLIVLLMTGFMFSLSARSAESRMWSWWGEYWPDGYVEQSILLSRWISGELSYVDTGLIHFRNGQAWVVPLALALLSKTGLTDADAFFLLNAGSILAALALIASLLRESTDARVLTAVFWVLAASSLPVLRSATSLTTDATALLGLALFIVSFTRFISNSSSVANTLAVAGTIALACQIRIALLPLVLVPATAGVWTVLRSRIECRVTRETWHYSCRLAIPTILGAALLLACWHALDVTETLATAREFSQLPEFIAGFKWSDYVRNTLNVAYPMLTVLLLWRLRASRQPRWPTTEEIAVVSAAIGTLSLLAIAQFLPRYRYWAPAGLLFAYLAAKACKSEPRWRQLVLTILVINSVWILLQKAL